VLHKVIRVLQILVMNCTTSCWKMLVKDSVPKHLASGVVIEGNFLRCEMFGRRSFDVVCVDGG